MLLTQLRAFGSPTSQKERAGPGRIWIRPALTNRALSQCAIPATIGRVSLFGISQFRQIRINPPHVVSRAFRVAEYLIHSSPPAQRKGSSHYILSRRTRSRRTTLSPAAGEYESASLKRRPTASACCRPQTIASVAQLSALCTASPGNCTGASSKDQAAFSSGQQVQNSL